MKRTTSAGNPAPDAEALAPLAAFLARVRLLLWGARAGEAALRALAVAAVALVLNTLLGERLAVAPWALFGVAACGSAAVVAALVGLALRLRPPARIDAARRVQRVVPELHNDVETSLELAAGGGATPTGISRALVAALVARTGADLAGRRAARVVPAAGLRRAALVLAAAALPVAALALTGAGIPSSAARALLDPRVYWPLGRLSLAVEPGDALVARGAAFVVRARVTGARPAAVLLRTEEPGAAGVLVAMGREADGAWSWRSPQVFGDFRYRAVADGTASPWHEVRVVDPPAAGNFEVVYTYPGYSGLGSRRASGGADLEALPGTTAEVSFATTRPVARGTVVLGESRIPVAPSGPGRYAATLYLGGARSYRLELEDADGIGNGGGTEYAIRYLPDAPPAVEIVQPVGSAEGDPEGSLPVAWRAADDFGLSQVSLVARSGGRERRTALGGPESGRAAGGEREVDLGALEPRPGEVVTIVLEAADNDTIGGPKTAVSAPLVVTIADPRARSEEARASMEKLAEELLDLLAEELELEGAYGDLRERAEQEWDAFPWEDVAEAAAGQERAADAARRAGERAEALARQLERDPEVGDDTVLQAELIRDGIAALRERRLAPMDELAPTLAPEQTSREEAAEKTGYLGRTAGEAARAAEQLALMADTMRRESRMAEAGRSAAEMGSAEERILDGLERLAAGDRAEAEKILRELDELQRALEELAEALAAGSTELPEEYLNSDAVRELDLNKALGALAQVRERIRRGDLAGARQAARELASQLEQLRAGLERADGEFEEKMARALGKMRGQTVPELQRILAEQRALLGRSEALAREVAATAAPPDPDPDPDPAADGRRRRAGVLAAEQQELREATERVGAELAALRAALPFIPAETAQSVERAGAFMGEAAAALAVPAPGQALTPQREAIAELSRAAQSASSALDAMSGMQASRRGMGPGGTLGLQPRGAPGGTSPGSSTSRGRRSGGRRGIDVRAVPIPGRGDYRPPRLYREEIIRSLRDGFPARYEERIREYFRRIAE